MATSVSGSEEQYPVYTGVWTNWSRGQVMGATLTLSRQKADLIIAFTSFFLAFIGIRTWRILCFCLHRYFSTSLPQDSIYHQRQAILVNSSSPESGAYLFLRLLWAARHSKRPIRVVPTVIAASLCVAIFVTAGGFSSQISTSVGSEVLINSANCGAAVSPGFDEDANAYFAFLPYSAKKVNDAANYAQRCYTDTSGADCRPFVTPHIQSDHDLNASCPFSEIMCRNQSGNIRIDSGYVDSHQHLGLNMPANQRIQWRNVIHCAPMVTKGYTSQENDSQVFTRYHYGNFSGSKDYIYKAASLESQYLAESTEDISLSYASQDVQ